MLSRRVGIGLAQAGLVALTAVANGCAGGTNPPAQIEAVRFAPGLMIELGAMIKTVSGLYYRDLEPGRGAPMAVGQTVVVRYRGQLVDGTPFDATAPNGDPIEFRLGAGRVIGGWDEGIVGMKVGGKRQLVVPAALGYGARGSGPIPPHAILVFTIELVGVR